MQRLTLAAIALMAAALSLIPARAYSAPTDATVGAGDGYAWGRDADNEVADPGPGGNGHGGSHGNSPADHQCIPGKDAGCIGPPAPQSPKKTPDPETTAREAIAKLKLTNPTPNIGPNPNNNPWHMLTTGYPLWLWTNTPNTLTTTTHNHGLTITLTATRTHTTYNHGDHTTQTCTTTTPYNPHTTPATPSPTCGHTYQTPSPTNTPYTITATDHWTITWHTNTQHGTLTTTTTGHTTITIGQLTTHITG